MARAFRMVGCLPEGLFAPNEAGWAIYQRSDYFER